MKYLILLLLVGCASAPLTEEERFEREYAEADRKNLYIMWEEQCKEAKGIIYSYNPSKICTGKRNCIPSKWDWRYNSKKERPYVGNSVVCISSRQLREMFR